MIALLAETPRDQEIIDYLVDQNERDVENFIGQTGSEGGDKR